MEQQFKKLLQLYRDQNDPLFKTFEGAIFKETAWFLQTETIPLEVEGIEQAPLAIGPKKGPRHVYSIEVLFVGDTYKGEGEDLLGKMIVAMKLKENEFARLKFDEELEQIDDLAHNLAEPDKKTCAFFSLIKEKKPRIVVSLGATVTNILLGKREKLSSIHGQFIEKTIDDDCFFTLVPLFHPEFLIINPNMKRTAWIDLQKVMEHVGKI